MAKTGSLSKILHYLGVAACALGHFVLASTMIANRPTAGPFLDGKLPRKALPPPSAFDVQNAFTNLVFQNPMGLASVPGSGKLVVWEREGRVWTFENRPDVSDKNLILDISSQCQGWGAAGIFSVAFHPGFATNHLFFVYYLWVAPGTVRGDILTEPPESDPSAYHERLSRFQLDGETAAVDSEVVLIDQLTQHINHTGGDIFFNPQNGFLYWSNGDLENGPTQAIDQDLVSGIFRLDVDERGGAVSHAIPRQPAHGITAHYFIPTDNPFVGATNALEEFYALGLRNPYRMSFDQQTGRTYIGDVGSVSREEVDVIEATDPGGLNFQWNQAEGFIGTLVPPYIGTSKQPILDYSREDGGCVIGGYVYRGSQFSNQLGGRYIFGDNLSLAIWCLDESTIPAQKIQLAQFPFGEGDASSGLYLSLSSFGIDDKGEIYMCQLSTTGGRIYKLAQRISAPPGQGFPNLLSETGIFLDVTNLVPSPQFIPYDVNSPLWSDGAEKKRWFTIPKNTKIGFSASGEWNFPPGSVFVKHFELPSGESDSNAAPHRLETRVMVRSEAGGVFGATYKWRSDNTDAELVTEPINETEMVSGANGTTSQIWHFPGPSECLQCHNFSSKGVLGLNTRQLNREFIYPTGGTNNQINAFDEIGLLYPSLAEGQLDTLPKLAGLGDTNASNEIRARSYLDSNCSHCHRPGGAHAYWDARFETPIELSGLLNGAVGQSFGIVDAKTISPGHPEKSMVLRRLSSIDPAMKMPPLGKNIVDTNAVKALGTYISSLPAATNTLPAGWKVADIGTVTTPSSVAFSANSLSIVAGDGETYGVLDSCAFVYHELDGDGEIIGQITATSGSETARIGAMMRASLEPDSPYAMSCQINRWGASYFDRVNKGDSTDFDVIYGISTPVLLRLVRTGNVFDEYYSWARRDWVLLHSATIEMPQHIYAGFAASGIIGVGSFVVNNIQTANFPTLNASPTALVTAQLIPGAEMAGPVLLQASPSDADGYPAMVEFFDGDVRLGQATSAPFQLLASLNSGTHSFSAKVYDNFGATGTASLDPVQLKPLQITLSASSAPGQIEFSHSGNPGIVYVTESSANLVDWAIVADAMPTDGKVQFTIPKSDRASFFRVRPK